MNKHRYISYRHFSGFTLLEIMIVVAIIAMLVAIAVPSFQRARIQSQNSRFRNDLRVISDALAMYAADNVIYPTDQDAGIIPPELVPYLPSSMNWSNPTSIGGLWDYCGKTWSITAGIGVYGPSRTATEMSQLGTFTQTGGEYVEIIQQ